MNKPIQLTVLVYQDAGFYIAQCLEYDLAAQGRSLVELKEAFAATVVGQVTKQIEHGMEPLANTPAAPKRFKKMLQGAEALPKSQNIKTKKISKRPGASLKAHYAIA